MQRDLNVLNLIVENAPKDRKLRVLEMGSGRGGMARTITNGLIEKDMLKYFVATNISDVENKYNAEQGMVFGDKYKVRKISFDDLFGEGAFTDADVFDVIVCCESLLHCKDKAKMARDVGKLLDKDGVLFISDILQNPNATPEQLKQINDRFGSKMYINMGTRAEYEDILVSQAGLTKISATYQTE